MKQYPKVPRYDHPTVPQSFYDSDDLCILEKSDGSNFRFMLYDSDFSDVYTPAVNALDVTDGDIIFGSKGTIRGTLTTSTDQINGNFNRVVQFLRETLTAEDLRRHHQTHGPLVFFVENMVFHTLDYGYTQSPPDPAVGFDIYAPRQDDRDTIPSDPFEELFDGFLPIETAWDIFDDIGIPTAHVYEGPGALNVNPSTYEIPQSTHADVQAEGVVFRSDSCDRRTKSVTSSFQELNRQRWGAHEKDAETGEDRFVALFCPDARVRGIVATMLQDHGYSLSDSILPDLTEYVYYDIWSEERHEIKSLNFTFTPADVPAHVAVRCEAVVNRMKTNAALNDARPEHLWRDFNTPDAALPDIPHADIPSSAFRPHPQHESGADVVVNEFCTTHRMERIAQELVLNGPHEFEPALIESLYPRVSDDIWNTEWPTLMHLPVAFTPNNLSPLIAKRCAEYVQSTHPDWAQ